MKLNDQDMIMYDNKNKWIILLKIKKNKKNNSMWDPTVDIIYMKYLGRIL